MFWNFNSSPQIDTVFFKEDLTLNELLDQENVLQELKSQNMKLIDFITRHDVMMQLISLVTEEPSEELDERERYRRPNIACEVLTTDIPVLNEMLAQKCILSKLYSFLEADPPLNSLLASFFSRTLSILICRKTDQNWYSYQFTCLKALDFFKCHENSLDLLLKHLGTSAIMDLTLKLITQVEGPEMRQNILEWLKNKDLVSSVISLFEPGIDADRQYNAAQMLCDTISKCREMFNSPTDKREDPILEAIQSPAMIEKLLGNMLGEVHSESSIVGGISVLLTLLEPPSSTDCFGRRGPDDLGSGELPDYINFTLQSTVSTIVPYLHKFHDLLINPPKKDGVKLAFGPVDPPLGNTRLSVIKLFAALIATNSPEVNATLNQLDTVNIMLDLFFQYTWNNFLHTQVEKCLAFALKASNDNVQNNPLIESIFVKCVLIQRILNAWNENETETTNGGKRKGYMGHLIKISNSVVRLEENGPQDLLKELVDAETLTAWHTFVEESLMPINIIHQSCLGGSHPAHNSSKDDDGFKDIPFSDDANVNHTIVFSSEDASSSCDFIKYQERVKSESWAKKWNDCTAQDDTSDLKAKREAIKEICRSHVNQMSLELLNEVWVDMSNSVWVTDETASNSSDEDDKTNADVFKECFLDADLWSSVGVGTPVRDERNPWLKSDGEVVEDNEGWADFSSNFNLESQLQAVHLSEPSETFELSQTPPDTIAQPASSDSPSTSDEAEKKESEETTSITEEKKSDEEAQPVSEELINQLAETRIVTKEESVEEGVSVEEVANVENEKPEVSEEVKVSDTRTDEGGNQVVAELPGDPV